MRIINFTLLAVLSCIAMIGAIPVEDGGSLAGSVVRRQDPGDICQAPLYYKFCEDCNESPDTKICKEFCDALPDGLTRPSFCTK